MEMQQEQQQDFMRTRSVPLLVFTMALPMTLSMLVNSLYNIVDSYFVARISESAMTALSLVYPVQNIVTAVTVGFGIGVNAAISYFLGAREQKNADSAATAGLILNIVHGAILTVLFIAIMPWFLGMFTDDSQIFSMGLQYANIVLLFSIPIGAGMSMEKIFQATGLMKTSMFCMLCGCATNLILDPLLIFGIGFFPELGIRGAAIATGTGQVVALLVYIIFYFARGISVRFSWGSLRGAKSVCGRMYAVGIPAALNLALASVTVSALNAILSAFSSSYVLVLGAYYKLQTFLYLTANGIVQGMRPICGYNYGAKEYRRVKKIFWVGLLFIAVVMLVGTVLCLTIPGALIGIFTENSETVAIGAHALRIICAGFIVSAVSVTVSGTLEGLGKGVTSLVISVLRYVAIIIPAAFILSRFIAADGVWNAFWVAELVTAAVAALLFARVARRELRD
ncbi:MAG: MATE family efflux transporter [Clostridiales bacterium]|nr:MATE family efflux transporter [Clostridiales bacterium]